MSSLTRREKFVAWFSTAAMLGFCVALSATTDAQESDGMKDYENPAVTAQTQDSAPAAERSGTRAGDLAASDSCTNEHGVKVRRGTRGFESCQMAGQMAGQMGSGTGTEPHGPQGSIDAPRADSSILNPGTTH